MTGENNMLQRFWERQHRRIITTALLATVSCVYPFTAKALIETGAFSPERDDPSHVTDYSEYSLRLLASFLGTVAAIIVPVASIGTLHGVKSIVDDEIGRKL
jgi:hypothetical protein